MEKKNLIQYALLVLVAFIVVLGLVNFFKTSELRKAMEKIDSAKLKTEISNDLLNNQKQIIDEIKNSNVQLVDDLKEMEQNYKKISVEINSKIKTLNLSLSEFNQKISTLSQDTLPIK